MSDWWNSKSPAQKKAYLKAHPNSKYGKRGGAKAKTRSAARSKLKSSGGALKALQTGRNAGKSVMQLANRYARTKKTKDGDIKLYADPRASAKIKKAVKEMNATLTAKQKAKLHG